jgi:heme-NO-binding protein
LPVVHGLIFASLGDYLAARLGADTAAALLAGEPAYLLSESYPDERLVALVKRAARESGQEEPELLRDFGAFTAEQTFARLYPAYFSIAGGTRAFLLGVETYIHELVRATMPSARPPRLTVRENGSDGVEITYSSPRRLCHLLVGLTEGTGRHYGENVELTETACMLRGDPACRFDVRISPASPAA